MPRKGYYTNGVFKGLVNGKWMNFPTEREYHEYIDDLESESNRGDKHE